MTATDRSLRSVFVGNIPYEVTEEKLKDIFSEVGPVLSFRLVFDRDSGKPKGYGFCEYQDQETALSAMRNLNGYELSGRSLRVDNATSEKNREELKTALQQSQPPPESPYGDPVPPQEAPEAISRAVASLPPEQMYEVMKQMKIVIQNNPVEARNMLLQNPQLAYALLQAQVVMRIVEPHVAMTLLHKQTDAPAPLIPPESMAGGPGPGQGQGPGPGPGPQNQHMMGGNQGMGMGPGGQRPEHHMGQGGPGGPGGPGRPSGMNPRGMNPNMEPIGPHGMGPGQQQGLVPGQQQGMGPGQQGMGPRDMGGMPRGMGPQEMNRGGMGQQDMGRGGMGPQDMGRGGMGPQEMNRGGMGPQDMNRGGMAPQDMNRGGMGPQDMNRGGMGPQDMNRGGMGPQDMNRGGMGPQEMNRGGMGAQDMGRGGMAPQDMNRGGMGMNRGMGEMGNRGAGPGMHSPGMGQGPPGRMHGGMEQGQIGPGGGGPRGGPGGPGMNFRGMPEGPGAMDEDLRSGGPRGRPSDAMGNEPRLSDPRVGGFDRGDPRGRGGPGGDPRAHPEQMAPSAASISALAQNVNLSQTQPTAQDQEKAALIMQVLQLSPEQINLLPPEQRASIMVLKEQIARSQGGGVPS